MDSHQNPIIITSFWRNWIYVCWSTYFWRLAISIYVEAPVEWKHALFKVFLVEVNPNLMYMVLLYCHYWVFLTLQLHNSLELSDDPSSSSLLYELWEPRWKHSPLLLFLLFCLLSTHSWNSAPQLTNSALHVKATFSLHLTHFQLAWMYLCVKSCCHFLCPHFYPAIDRITPLPKCTLHWTFLQ